MKNKIKYIIISCLICFACEKEVKLDIPVVEEDIVVEGYIEQGGFPKVYLSLSTSFFSEVDSAALFDLMVHQAKVTVSDGSNTEILTLRRNNSHYPIYFYEGTDFLGKVGSTYYLTIELDGRILTAQTTIPKPPKFDNIWVESFNDTACYLRFSYTDDINTRDYYRTFMKVQSKDSKYIPTFINVFDDVYFNGTTVEFNLYRGYAGLGDVYNHNKYLTKGDTVMVRFCTMDQAHFDFWNTFQGKMLNIASFAPSMNKVISNINGGLGVWGGYGTTYYKIITK